MTSPELYAELIAWLDAGVKIAAIIVVATALAGAVAGWDRHSRALRQSRAQAHRRDRR